MGERDNNGKFLKGHSGLKRKGTLNKKTVEIKQRIEKVLELLDESLETDLMALSPKEKIQLWMDLQEFIRPKLQRTQTDLTTKGNELTKITFEVVNGRDAEHKG
ncbi:MAG: hypothetical protein HOG34_00800 [Bacteroidetes bacterium]|jgi:hypothetical protein|nr:hypothetical protein [Bacteroidota bacterium]MBT4399386.1 hypothetical protein [Bacteroidota bacterium]MBT4968581.1 hypothetical protein [Bacteroidota bacterium]